MQRFVALDRSWHFVELDDEVAALLGRERDAVLGRTLWDAFPEVVGSRLEAPLREVMTLGGATTIEFRAASGRALRASLTLTGRHLLARISPGLPGGDVPPGGAQLDAPRTPRLLPDSYRELFDALDEGFCVVEMLYDDHGTPVDYRFVEHNPAFERHTGLRGARGRTARELVPDLEHHWVEAYARVATTGEPARFVNEAQPMGGRWFDVFAVRLGGDGSPLVALHFADITRQRRTEEELRFRSEQIHTLLEAAPLGMYLVDADFRVGQVNAAARPVFDGVADLVGRDFGEVIDVLFPNAYGDAIVRRFRHTLETGESFHAPELAELTATGGEVAHYDWRIHRILLPDGRYGVVCYFSDVSASVAARRAIARSEERYRTLFESIDEGFCILEVTLDEEERAVDYRFLETNPAFDAHSGLEDALGRTITELVPSVEPHWFEVYGRVAKTGEPERFDDRFGSLGRWFDGYAFRIGEPHERKVAVLFNDVTLRKRTEEALRASEAQLRHRAHHDALTGLPNRLLFEDRLQQAVSTAARHGRTLAVLFVDIDGFKLINDSLGHAAGDVVLEEVASRLRGALREADTLARLHGDEFAVVLPELSGPEDAERLARSLLVELERPTVAAGKVVSVSASIGVSLFPRDGADPKELMQAADAAMYRVKGDGKHDVRLFAPAMRAAAADRVAVVEHLDGAIDRGEMRMRYQPQWDSRTGSIAAFESLLRWTSPILGDVSPARFVPAAEDRGLFGPIAAWSIDRCGVFVNTLSNGFGLPLRVALNVTPARLVRSDFRALVEETILRHRLAPQQLELELTMGAFVEDAAVLRGTIERMAEVGARVVLDRFGAADASLAAALLDLPFAAVKIDPELVHRAVDDARLRRGLESVVSLVHDLGLEVAAAGIETLPQRDLMLGMHCERLQGSLIGRPMSCADAQRAVRDQPVSTLF